MVNSSLNASQTGQLAGSHRFNSVFTGNQSAGGCDPAFDFRMILHDATHLPCSVINIRIRPDLP
jgi:hypothetical protein